MAILNMKKLRVIAMAEQRRALLKGLMALGCVEISERQEEGCEGLERSTSHLLQTRNRLGDVHTALAAIHRYGQIREGWMIRRFSVSRAVFWSEDTVKRGEEVCDEVNGALGAIARLQREGEMLRARRGELLPWRALDVPLEQGGTAAAVGLWVCPAGVDPGEVRSALAAEEIAAELYEVGTDRRQRYVTALYHRGEEERLLRCLQPFRFSAASFPGLSGTAEENIRRLDETLEENSRSLAEARQRIVACVPRREELRLYADVLSSAMVEQAGEERMLTDGTILTFRGWMPARCEREVGELLEGLNCAWEMEDPAEEEYDQVPVRLENNGLTEPMNLVTEMYSLPAYDGVDPNPLMAPFFVLFFGMMLADMGYGLLMVAVSAFVRKKYAPKGTMGHVFGIGMLCGVSAFFWGALTGGFFGDFIPQLIRLYDPESTFALPSLFTPLNDALMVLLGALVLGVIQIFTGMAISIYQKVRRGRVMEALCGEVAWYAVFLCLALGAMTGKWSEFLLGAAVILLLTQGYGKKGLLGKLMGIGGSLYNHITGYFSDILSYSRLMALMLAGAVIAQVFNTLGAITGNLITFLLISFAGNALNFGLNLLGCYVHDLRLQCLEYFGRFYEDGGRPFAPLAAQTQYVDIED